MIDEAMLSQINDRYVCPADAGPAWRAACEFGFDMSLVEESLRLTPEQRLHQHQEALNMLLALKPDAADGAKY